MNQDLAPGTIFAEKYRILDRIGRGGMGTVYAAQHMGLDRKLAIKLLHRRGGESDAFLKRFVREARVASSVEHQNIVDVTDAGITPDRTAYYVMEHLKGEDLATMFRREGPLPWRRAAHIVIQICDALQAAHDKGIIHRDIKPANCFRISRGSNDDFIKVLDFGIAKVKPGEIDRTSDTSVGDFLGTARYMPPEQAQSPGTVDHRVDIYAVGVVLYEALTGTTPFTGSNPGQVLHNLFLKDPPSLREVNPNLPEEVEAVTMKALRRDPDARHQSMRAFSRALEKLRIVRGGEWRGSVEAGRRPVDDAPLTDASTLKISLPREERLWSRDSTVTSLSPRGRLLWPLVALISAGLLSVTAYALVTRTDPTGTSSPPPPTTQDGPEDDIVLLDSVPVTNQALEPTTPNLPEDTDTSTVETIAQPKSDTEGPPSPKRPVKSECDGAWRAASERYDEHAWSALLMVLERPEVRRCWAREPRATQRRKYRVEALKQTKQFERCVEEGTGMHDPDVERSVSMCARRLEAVRAAERAQAAASAVRPAQAAPEDDRAVDRRTVDAPLEVGRGAS